MHIERLTPEDFLKLDKLLIEHYSTNAINDSQKIVEKALGKPISKHQIRRRKSILGLVLTKETKARLSRNTHKPHTNKNKQTPKETIASAIFKQYLWDKGYSFCAKELGLSKLATTALANRLGFKVNPRLLKKQAKRNEKKKKEYQEEHKVILVGIRKPTHMGGMQRLAAYLPWNPNIIRELRPSYIQDWPK